MCGCISDLIKSVEWTFLCVFFLFFFLMWKYVADYNNVQKIRHYVVTDLLKVKVIEAKN